MDKRSARRKGPAIIRLDAEIDSIAGRSTYGNGQRVYGARRIQAQRRAAVMQMLRAEMGVPVPTVVTTPEPSVSDRNTPPVAAQRTTRAVCAALIVVGIAVAVAAPRIDSAGLALAAAPFGKLIGAIFGRQA